VDREQLVEQFRQAMLGIYDASAKLKPPYRPTKFRRMVIEQGAKETADILLAPGDPSEGFGTLVMHGKEGMKLCVEYLVLQAPWRELFEPEQLSIARERLLKVGGDLPPEDSHANHGPVDSETVGAGLAKARWAFIERLKQIKGTPVKKFTEVLDDFIAWSGQFNWAVEFFEKKQEQKVVRYVLRGGTTPLWVAYPQVSEPSKLSIIETESGRVTKSVQDWVLAKLHKLDVGQPKDAVLPKATFHALRDPGKRENVKCLLVELLGELQLSAPPECPVDPPSRVQTTVTRVVRDSAVAFWVKQIHEYRCQICGERIDLPDGRHYAEAHHIKPLGGDHEGPDVRENVLCVCPNHHAALDFMVRDINLAELRPAEGHTVGEEYVRHHNAERKKRWG